MKYGDLNRCLNVPEPPTLFKFKNGRKLKGGLNASLFRPFKFRKPSLLQGEIDLDEYQVVLNELSFLFPTVWGRGTIFARHYHGGSYI